jgi:DNA-directed RNA polymerase subunit H (RpoH/RPB5)
MSSITKNAAMQVIDTLHTYFLPYRNLRYVGNAARSAAADVMLPAVERPNVDKTAEDLKRLGYYRIDAARNAPRGKRDVVVIYVLDSNSKYANTAADLKTLIANTLRDRPIVAGRLDEIIIVAESAMFAAKKNMIAVIRQFQELAEAKPDAAKPDAAKLADAAKPAAEVVDAAYFTGLPYEIFYTAVPECAAVPRYRIMSGAEIAEYLEFNLIKTSALKVLYDSDPPIVWLGARDKQFVMESRDSESTLEYIEVYRIMRTMVK